MDKLIMEDNIINIEVEQAPINNVLTKINGTVSLDFTDFEEVPFCFDHENNIDEVNIEAIETGVDNDEDIDFDDHNDFGDDRNHLFLDDLDFNFDFNIDDL